jgi:hypothetical protein
LQQVGDLGVAELLEFAEEENFAVEGVELFDGPANPQARFRSVLFGGIAKALWLAEEHGAESGFAVMSAKDLEGDGV